MRNLLRNLLRNLRRNLLRNLRRNLLRNLPRNLLRNLLRNGEFNKGLSPAVFTDGWDGMGWTEYQKCPLKIFILCWYIEKVYTYL